MRRFAPLLATAALAAACGNASRVDDAAVAPPSGRPALVVLLVVDQWPEWAFEAKRAELHGGFARLLSEGEWRVGRHPSATTLTAPGHSLLGTGKTSNESGIVSNEWYRRAPTSKVMTSVASLRGGQSAEWLRVPGLGDAVAAANNGARAVSVSLKDRAAILPLGHAGLAIWYAAPTVDWQSSAPAPWLDEWNRVRPISRHLHDVWEPLDRDLLKRLSGRRDDEIGEYGEKGFGATFPHAVDRTKVPAEALLAAPIGNDLVLDTAGAAIDGERLGQRGATDLLVISLSAHDYIAHGWGHESWEAWDATLRLDQRLGAFFAELDRKVGAGRWALLATSDHGASHLPELVGGGRLRFSQIQQVANDAAQKVLGPGAWIADPKYPTLYLSDRALDQPPAKIAAATDAIVAALREMPGLSRVERSADLTGHCETRTGDDVALCLSLDPERSGEVLYLPAENWLLEDDDELMAASHGTPHAYDQLVPVITLPLGRTPHAPQIAPSGEVVPIEQVSAILADWLGITAPAKLPRAK